MKVLVLGDLHGDSHVNHLHADPSVRRARLGSAASIRAVDHAVEYGIGHIIQVGDFGFWPGRDGIVFLDRLNAALVESNVILTWLDGNHEWHDGLDALVKIMPQNQHGQTYIRSNILYSPRGCIWTMANKKFMTIGGAVSVDKRWRVVGKSWWPQEALTAAQSNDILVNIVARRRAGKRDVDYLFTHDTHRAAPFRERLKDDIESTLHRELIGRIVDVIRPPKWFHGHYHERYDWTLEYTRPFSEDAHDRTTRVYGLACDGMRDNWGILDTEIDTFTFDTDL